MYIDEKKGVPGYEVIELHEKKNKYCVLIPILNERENIELELKRAMGEDIHNICDIIICDGNSKDGSNDPELLQNLGVCTILIKKTKGRQGAQLRMGFDYAINAGYDGFITIDGNNKDSIEDCKHFVTKLEEGYDFVQGSRFIKGGIEINTPKFRKVMVKLIHAPIISITAHKRYTDTTNAFRCHSRKYITDPRVDIFRDIFTSYELLAYLSVRADQLKMKTCEIPVARIYPEDKVPTKIKGFKGNFELLEVLFLNMFGIYKPYPVAKKIIKSFLVIWAFISIALLFLSGFFLYRNIGGYTKAYNSITDEIKAVEANTEMNETIKTENLNELKQQQNDLVEKGINYAPGIICLVFSTLAIVATSYIAYGKKKHQEIIDGEYHG